MFDIVGVHAPACERDDVQEGNFLFVVVVCTLHHKREEALAVHHRFSAVTYCVYSNGCTSKVSMLNHYIF